MNRKQLSLREKRRQPTKLCSDEQITTARLSVINQRESQLDLSHHFNAIKAQIDGICSNSQADVYAIRTQLSIRWRGLHLILTAFNPESLEYQLCTCKYNFAKCTYDSTTVNVATLSELLDLDRQEHAKWTPLNSQDLNWIVWSTPQKGEQTEISQYFSQPHNLSIPDYFSAIKDADGYQEERDMLQEAQRPSYPVGKPPNETPTITFMGDELEMPDALSYTEGRALIKAYLQTCGCNSRIKHRRCKTPQK